MGGVRGSRQRADCAVRAGPLGRLEGFRFRLLAFLKVPLSALRCVGPLSRRSSLVILF